MIVAILVATNIIYISSSPEALQMAINIIPQLRCQAQPCSHPNPILKIANSIGSMELL
jgi:hypothetical protein